MTRVLKLATLVLFASLLSGCAYKPLKAPCSADEDGAALAFAEMRTPRPPEPFASFTPCGPMRPL